MTDNTITAEQYHKLPADQQRRYANLRGGRWVDRATLDSVSEPNDAGRPVSQEDYDNMSISDRIAYARQHDQKQMPAWKDPRV